MFSKARVGDVIFSMRGGPVRIVEINNSHTNYPNQLPDWIPSEGIKP